MSAIAAPPVSPFKGLAAFEDADLDALFFFGRERERKVIVANLLATRLTVLYGESGVGKSSLLAAAVVRDLRDAAPGAPIVLHGSWSGELADITAEFASGGDGYLILDQFEEFFLYHPDDGPGGLLHDLVELLATTRVNVLVSLRDDSLARLDTFKARIPSVFANQLRLEHLDAEQARSAVLGPLERWSEVTGEQVEAEPVLVQTVLDAVAVDDGHVEAPYLQLVLARIWTAEREANSAVLRLETLERLGGAAAIVREQLHGALESLDPRQQDVAAAMFEHLVTPTGTKIALRAADLAAYADVSEDDLRSVLARLTRERLVHPVDGSDRYEIFHDVLAEPVTAWRLERSVARERAAAQRRQRRLLVVASSALVALALVAALAVWAISERGNARTQAREARARALDATALQQLPVDPNRSVRLSLAATRLGHGGSAEGVLRQAMLADRLRLVKHTPGAVRAVATSPRGDLIAAGLAGNKVLLLDARNRRLVRTIVTPRPVAAVGFVDGGRRLVTATPERLAQLWDVATGRRVPLHGRAAAARTPDGGIVVAPLAGALARAIGHVQHLAASADGERLAAVVMEHGAAVARLYDRRGRLIRRLRQRGPRDVTFSPDGSLLATAGADGLTGLWSGRTGKGVRALRDAKSGVTVLAFSPDGRFLATGGEDSGIRIWKPDTGERVFVFLGHTNPIDAIAWSPDSRIVATASPDHNVLLWRVQRLVGAGSYAATLAGSRGPVRAIAFSPAGTRLVSGSDDATVRVWDVRPDQQLAVLGRAPGPALAVRWAGQTIVGLWPHVVKTYASASRRRTHALRGRGTADFSSLGVSADAAVIAAGAVDGETNVWNGRTGALLFTERASTAVTSVAVSPHGDLVASGDGSGVITMRDVQGRMGWSARQTGAVADLAFAPDGSKIVTAGPRGAVVWDAETGKRLYGLPSAGGDSRSVFSPDGKLVATAGLDANGRLWFVDDGRLYRTLRGHKKALTDIEFSPDGHRVVTAGQDADAWVWNVDNGLGHSLQRSSFGTISSAEFDHSGRWVAAAAPISLIMWVAASGRQLFYVRGHTDVLTAATFAPAAPTVATSSRDGTIATYSCTVCVDLPQLVHKAKVRLAQTR